MVETTQDQAQALSGAYQELIKATADCDHVRVAEVSKSILEIEKSEKTEGAQRAHLISLIKKREFSDALLYLNKSD